MNISFILLDICGTVVNFQTADKFIFFVIGRLYPNKKYIVKFFRILYWLKLPLKFGFNYKFAILKLLKETEFQILDKFAQEYFLNVIKNNFNKEVFNLIDKIKKVNKDVKIIIVSGGYNIYIKYIAEYIGAYRYVTNELEFRDSKFTGKIIFNDCMGVYKILKLFQSGLLEEFDFNKTAIISDSFSDMPLFSLGRYKYVVNPDSKLRILIGKGWEEIKEN